MHISNGLRVAIIDYGMGNLFSVKQACEHIGLSSVITSERSVILNADAVILPGVGAFSDAMNNLSNRDLIMPIKEFIESGRFFMGVCLGMQLLMSYSEEFGYHRGLDIIKGSVTKFAAKKNNGQKIKVPQIGWNKILRPVVSKQDIWDKSPLVDIDDGEYMYFVHSYYAVPADLELVLSITEYGGIEYCSSILWRNVFACQFHPERSGRKGLGIYKNWLRNYAKTH